MRGLGSQRGELGNNCRQGSAVCANNAERNSERLTIGEELAANHRRAHGNEPQQNVQPQVILRRRHRGKLVLQVVERVVNQESRGRDERLVVLGICLDISLIS